MAVYVDDPIWPFRGMLMCHMTADELDELHQMASALGLKRSWFQDKPNGTPHYDIAKSKRAQAIKLGAIEIDRRKTVEIIHYWRAKRMTKEAMDAAVQYITKYYLTGPVELGKTRVRYDPMLSKDPSKRAEPEFGTIVGTSGSRWLIQMEKDPPGKPSIWHPQWRLTYLPVNQRNLNIELAKEAHLNGTTNPNLEWLQEQASIAAAESGVQDSDLEDWIELWMEKWFEKAA